MHVTLLDRVETGGGITELYTVPLVPDICRDALVRKKDWIFRCCFGIHRFSLVARDDVAKQGALSRDVAGVTAAAAAED